MREYLIELTCSESEKLEQLAWEFGTPATRLIYQWITTRIVAEFRAVENAYGEDFEF